MSASTPTGLSVLDLVCRRGGCLLFSGLSFGIEPGQALRITGANGAGKTSLMRLLAGLSIPEAGEIRWQGILIDRARGAYHSGLAWVGHADGLKPELTPRENLRFHQALIATPDAASLDAALIRFGIADIADRPCRTLSAGQRRRAALARLMVAVCPLWLLDEPLASLDRQGQSMVQALVDDHCADGGIVVFTSHQAFDAPRAQQREVSLS